jgi:hypothetical protein
MATKITIHTHHLLTANTSSFTGAAGIEQTPTSLVKKAELAKRLSVCAREIEKWMKQQMIPYVQMGPHCIRYDVEDVISELKKKYQVNPRERR